MKNKYIKYIDHYHGDDAIIKFCSHIDVWVYQYQPYVNFIKKGGLSYNKSKYYVRVINNNITGVNINRYDE